ncbi:superkiller protein 3 [Hygrophoropsis aurantiaca]|uniref:Superkiller protein 3 n=1 Tax=Hygrophoropsis aurantiaca TaxID=72124 RepID=A0ACB8AS55_9AGAM|nr:superkiller protein 3 [Hygrophoropsis aurantiaca]
MSSFSKAKLKAARDALGKKQYEVARDAATQVLDYEPDNYNAHVFLGLAYLELGENEKSEQFYRKATDLKPDQILAWQGISKLYEQNSRWDDLAKSLKCMISLFSESNDPTKCADALQKLTDIYREHGTRQQVIDALQFTLPHSPYYPVLSTLPLPDPTNPTATSTFAIQTAIHNSLPVIEEIILLTEKQEETTTKNEFEKRRTRLGAPNADQLRKDIGREVWGSSELPKLYDEVLNHPNTSDDLRRVTESKLVRIKQQYYFALPITDPDKVKIGSELDDLVSGMVTINIPDELAWSIFLEGKDVDSIEGYDFNVLQQYMDIFPDTPFSKLLSGYFLYNGVQISDHESSDGDDKKPDENDYAVDPYDKILDAFAFLSDSIISNRIAAEVYMHELDYQISIKLAESGLELLRRYESNSGRKLEQVMKAFNTILATSLVHLFPPKHHTRALRLLDDVLSRDPDNVDCLIGRGYVLQTADKWEEAEGLFGKADDLLPADLQKGLRAKEERAWCQSRTRLEDGLTSLKDVFRIWDDLGDRDADKARCLWRIGKCCWDVGGDTREDAFASFIKSLKCDSTYAPSYTSLGIYYAEHSTPLDPTRASKCFQKAFELDPREADAARRLAEGFAEEREWDLVEVVARRTIEGEGGLDAGMRDGTSAAAKRYLPTNAWAWKAVGVVELIRRNCAPSIEAFQVALRADPNDQLSWLRLGEAYSKAGRHAAALKALGRAHELQPDDWICSFFIAEVQRQMGKLAEALLSFQSILETRPNEIGILISISQTFLDLARHERFTGFSARAEQSFVSCVKTSLQAISESPGYRGVAWKVAGNALFGLSGSSTFADEADVRTVLDEVSALIRQHHSTRLKDVFKVIPMESDVTLTGLHALQVALAAYDYRITVGSTEDTAASSAWFDLGTALHYWTMKASPSESHQAASEAAASFVIEALKKDPGNATFWVTLGNIYFIAKPKASQHAYIKALDADSKNVTAWTNLGLLYFYHNDLELANEAFYKAQVLDPDHTIAWVGQALVATANGDNLDACTLLEHAVSLAADVPIADLEFASRVFSSLNQATSGRRSTDDILFPAFFVLDRYAKRCPSDACALHLFGLVCERLGKLELGVEHITRAISHLEALYEETEDTTVERQFTIAHANLARLRIATQDYAGALESFESVLGLLTESSEDQTAQILRVEAQFGCGLANFKMGDLQSALTVFQNALDAAGDNLVLRGHVTVLLGQTMWAIGTEEFRESAKALLLECITADPENLLAINTLAGMGILTEDDGLIDAALSEIQSLPIERRQELDPRRDVTYLLIQHQLGQGDTMGALHTAQKALYVEPSSSEIRRDVASLTLQHGDFQSAQALLAVRSHGNIVEESETLALSAISDESLESLKNAQRAVMLAPGQRRNWQTLAYVRARDA